MMVPADTSNDQSFLIFGQTPSLLVKGSVQKFKPIWDKENFIAKANKNSK